MIIGNYYINNALVAAVLVAVVGGGALTTGALDSLTSGDDKEPSQRNLSVSLESPNVEAGSVATFTVSGPDEEPVSGATVFVEGSEAGETSELGKFSFQTPDSPEVTVRVSTGRSNVTETIEVQSSGTEDGQEEDEDSGGGQEQDEGDNDQTGQEDDGNGGTDENTDDENTDDQNKDDQNTDDGNRVNESENSTTQVDVSASISISSQVTVGEEVSLDASESSGNITNYTWSFGDGEQKTTESASIQHTYSTEGSYEVTLTVKGKKNTEETVKSTLEVLGEQAPSINFISPSDGLKTDKSTLGYEFEIDNAASGAEYTVLIDESKTVSGTLEEGDNTEEESIDIPETHFSTSIRVQQDGETYSSEKRTVNASQSIGPQPEFTLNSPQEGDVLETLNSERSVTIEYEIEDRKWATSANLTLRKEGSKVSERPVSVVSGTHEEELEELSPANYTYIVELIEGDKKASKKKEFDIRKVEPEYSVTQDEPVDGWHVGSENPDDFQKVDFNVSYETDTDAELWYEIIALGNGSNTIEADFGEGSTTYTIEHDEGDIVANRSTSLLGGMEHNHTFEYTFGVELRYKWRSWIEVDEEEVKSTSFRTLNVTEEP